MRSLLIILTLLFAISAQAQQTTTYKGKQFSFTLYCDTGRCATDDIKVEDSVVIKDLASGKKVQTIIPPADAPGIPCKYMESSQLVVVDANFDGFDDFLVLQFLPANANLPYYWYIYNPKTKLFAEDTSLEGITSPGFDSTKQEIVNFWMGGCCDHGSDIYKYLNGKIVQLEETEIIYDPDAKTSTTIVSERVNGQLKEVSRKTEKADDN